jgi:pyridoxamine 5'-phosphate oxidase
MVCRRLGDDGALWIASDSRSAKNGELSRHPNAAALAWFPATREQFRFTGNVQIIGQSTTSPERGDLWRALSPETRATFLWPDPGESRASDDAFARSNDAAEPPASFEVLVLRPASVDHLDLKTHPHLRRRWNCDGRWIVREINP